MDRKTREELNDLSKRVWGSSSRWKKLVEKGFIEFFERDREVMVPGATGVKKKVFTDRKGVPRRYTIEEVRKVMMDLLEAQKPALIPVEEGNDVGQVVREGLA
jgi:hypothetical protein